MNELIEHQPKQSHTIRLWLMFKVMYFCVKVAAQSLESSV